MSLDSGRTLTIGGAVARHGVARLFSPVRLRRGVSSLGLDLQSDLARTVLLEQRDRPTITAYAITPLPEFKVTPDSANTPSALMPLTRALATLGAGSRPVTCGLGPPSCQVGRIPLHLGRGAARTTAMAEALRTIGLNADPESALGIVLPLAQGDASLLIAATREATLRLARRLKAARVAHARITSAVIALGALAASSPDTASLARFMVVHFGPWDTILALFEPPGPIAAKSLPISDRELTQSLTRPLSLDAGRVELDIRHARLVRERLDLCATGELLLPTGHTVETSQLIALVRPTLERLAVEIAKFARHHAPPGSRRQAIGPVFLLGDGAELTNLDRFLERELHMEVKLFNPLAGLRIGPGGKEALRMGARRQRLALAIGYALDAQTRVDLTPRPLRLERCATILRWGVRVAALVALVTMSLHFSHGVRQAARLKGELADIRLLETSLSPTFQQAIERDRLEAIRAQCERRREAGRKAEVLPLARLHAVLAALPDEAHVDQIRLLSDGHSQLLLEGEMASTTREELRHLRRRLVDSVEACLDGEQELSARFTGERLEGGFQRVHYSLRAEHKTSQESAP
ncbi:MAG: hypothetical protein AB1486_15260 [Planctomycetota bacterium]